MLEIVRILSHVRLGEAKSGHFNAG